jgi:hypothetical protein
MRYGTTQDIPSMSSESSSSESGEEPMRYGHVDDVPAGTKSESESESSSESSSESTSESSGDSWSEEQLPPKYRATGVRNPKYQSEFQSGNVEMPDLIESIRRRKRIKQIASVSADVRRRSGGRRRIRTSTSGRVLLRPR